MVRLEEKTGKLYFENGVYLGEILMKEDGFYDFYPELKGGYWDSALLHEIANLLDKMNAPWEEEINRYFEKRNK